MSAASGDDKLLPQLKRVLLELRDTRRQLEELEARDLEPIAIVGMACRFPGGADTPEALWELVAEGRDAISEFPADRGWDLDQIFDPDPSRPTTCYTRNGGFLHDAALFDAGLFSIAPREALAMDPQQRLLLEASWEALEHAGIDPTSVKGHNIGAYVGIAGNGYGSSVLRAPELEGFRVTGTLLSIASGRVAYTFGLEGPAVSIDTACSSSLVALHLACQALRRGECEQALAAGTMVFSSPALIIDFSRQRLLSPDGRCKAFGAAADGAGFSDGVGVVVLEPLSRARANGHDVLALIRGSAVNQDGASNGLIAPNGPSQTRVIRDALADAGVSAADIDVVEGHGTGTALGDPIEIQALLDTYGRERANGPLYLGSIKSNIGHASTAAGVAGVIKMVQALRHERLPRSLHCEEPSPHVDWSADEIALLSEPVAWPRGERPRRAGISSFGISGTNAHVILEEAPLVERAARDLEPAVVAYPLSGRDEAALRAQAERLHGWLGERPELEPVDVGFSLATGRAHLEHRAVVIGSDARELLAGLDSVARGEAAAGVIEGPAHPARGGRAAFVFPGQGSQWDGMALELLGCAPVFADALRACGEALSRHVDWSLEDVLRGVEGAPSLERVDVVQPALFAVMVALAALWRSYGVEPSAVVGHSQGEIAAAYVAGGLSLEDAARVVCLRSRAIAELLAGQGGMVSVALAPEAAAERIARFGERVSLAAVNGSASVVVSGELDALEELLQACEADGVWARRIPVDYPSHTVRVEDLRERLLRDLAGIEPRSGTVPFYSTISGEQIDTAELDAQYWYRNLRELVRFHDAVETLIEHGIGAFVEASPHPGLTVAISATVEGNDAAERVAVIETLRRDEGGLPRFLSSLAQAHVHGITIDWARLYQGTGAHRVDLPTYPFQRRRYWLGSGAEGDPTAVGQVAGEHPLLGAAVRVAGAEGWLLTGRVSLAAQPWLADHAVGGTVLLPATAFVELALAAAQRVGAAGLDDLTLVAPLVLDAAAGVDMQVSVAEPDEDGRRPLNVYSASGSAGEDGQPDWTLHATGLLAAPVADDVDAPSLGAWPPASAQEVDVEHFYAALADAGYEYGPAFRGLRAAWRDGDAWLAEVRLDEAQQADAAGFHVHPALLDAALHTALLAAGDEHALEAPVVPFSFAGVRLHAPGAAALRVRVELDREGEARVITLIATDEAGLPVLSVDQLEARPLDPAQLKAVGTSARSPPLYEYSWITLASEDAPAARAAFIGASELSVGDAGLEVDRHSDLASLERAVAEGASPPEVVLVAAPAGRGELHEDVHAVTASVLELLQAWLASEALADARLVVLTDGALCVRDGEQPDLAQAAVPGLVRSAASEDPLRFGLVDLRAGAAAGLAAALASDEPELALRDGAVLAPRLARVAADAPSAAAVEAEGAVLITGGTGGLGALVARHLAREHGARRLLLTSRRGLQADGAAALVAELEELGCEADVVACDVSDRAQLEALLSGTQLTGVIHAAGVLDDGTIASLDAERLHRVMAPKVDGALHLHELTRDRALSFFVLFSSAAAALGSPGQGNYAAANAFLDGLAHHRQAHGLPAISVAWGPWEQASGMVVAADAARLARFGIELLSDEQALSLLDAALVASHARLVPIALDAAVLRTVARAGALPPILSGVVRAPNRRGAGSKGALARMLAQAPESEWERITLDLIRGHIAAVLGHPSAQAVDPQRNFRDMGFDSLAAVELRNRLIQATGLRLPATVVFDHPTPAAVAAFVVKKVAGAARPSPAVARSSFASDEPIAIVGMSCRYPGGVRSPEELWRLVVEGRDAIGAFPEDRGWDVERLFHPDPGHLGSTYTRHGGFLYDAGEFDAGFFAMGPREALATDPQQRLLLEAAWEALEHAGIAPESLRRSDTGVFAGAMYQDYAYAGYGSASELEGWLAVGSAGSVVSGRIAYAFGFEGPAVTVDTACSSSLVALHLACQALRAGESSLALAGGVSVLANPLLFVEFSRQRGLSPDGRCKSFGADADGVGWAEGAGLVVLERLSDAQRRGHSVLAVVRGSAVNQDGASNGLAAPNGPSQERVIERALANAGLSPADIDVVEGHGTGTMLGDPIEAQALLETYGQNRANGPLRLGSIKSNIGHTQAAAGVAGVIKMVQALQHDLLPRSLHCEQPSPHVDWSAGRIALLHRAVAWPPTQRPRRAGISSFGISGTNAHLILEEAPAADGDGAAAAQRPAGDGGVLPFLVSASSEDALAAQAEGLAAFLEERPQADAYAVACGLALQRAQLPERAAVLATGRERLVVGLRALARGEEPAGVVRGRVHSGATAFLFSGQGSQWSGMGAGLYERFPVFAAALDEVCAELDSLLERPLLEVLFAEPDTDAARLLSNTRFTQVALFALEVALFRLLASFGVRPDFLIGHSVGELAAAHVAGVFSLADGCRLVAERARLMAALPAGGAMVAVEGAEGEVVESLAGFEGRVSLAAVNGPLAVTVSGEAEAVDELEARWSGRGRRTTRLDVSHAFHSQLMEPMLAELSAVAEGIAFAAPQVPIVSNVTGRLLTHEEACSPAYWVRHVREPVRFADGVELLAGAGVTRFLELGPNTVLAALAATSSMAESASAVFASVLRGPKLGEREALLSLLTAAHCNGVSVDWSALLDDTAVGRVELPTYAFQRRRYWLGAGVASDPEAVGQLAGEHPLLGAAVRLADAEGWLLTGRISLASQPWLADHAVGGMVLLPATAFVELALAAAQRVGAAGLYDLTLVAPLVLDPAAGVNVQVSVAEPDEDGRRPLNIYAASRAGEVGEDGPQWTLHATGLLAAADADRVDPPTLGAWPPTGAEAVDVEGFYERLADAGYECGPAFRGLRAAWRDGNAWLGEVRLDEAQQGPAAEFLAHPALLDAALHTALLAALDEHTLDTPAVPFSFAGVRLHAPGAAALRVRIELEQDGETRAITLIATDEAGLPALTIDHLAARPLDPAAIKAAGTTARRRPLYEHTWVQLQSPDAPTPRAALLGASDLLVDQAEIELDRHHDLASLEQAVADGASPPEIVLVAAPAGRSGLPEDAYAVTAHVLELLQAWLASEALADARLVVLTGAALAVRDGEQPNLAQAAVPGLVRSAASEDPLRFGLVDLGPGGAVGLGTALASDEPELALRDGAVFAPRLARAAVDEQRAAVALDPDGAVLISGGTGGLGALVARHLAGEHGVRRLLLTSRRGPAAAGAAELVAELAELGCAAEAVACDVTDRAQLEALLSGTQLTGVIHAAGVLDDGTIASLDGERLRTVMAPKVEGALNLHELTRDRELSFFVLFSSAAAALGSPGQGNYAAANAFLDGLAHQRQAQGLPAISIAWGPWEQAAGMVAAADAARLARFGIESLDDEQALALLDVALVAPDARLVPIALDAAALRTVARAGALPPILSGVVRAPARRGAGARGALARMLAQAPESEWQQVTLDLIRGHIAAVLGHPSPQAVDPDKSFKDMGFDSLAAVELRNRLIQATGLRLPATVVFDHPTPAAAAAYLVAKLAGAQRALPAATRPPAPTDEPIAIVGMSCRYPGGVRSPEELWRLVVEGRDAIGAFPEDRGWDVERLFDPDPERLGSSYTRHGGFVYDAGEFDAGFFAMGPREALATDPQQRLLLEVTWEALEHAGIDPDSLRRSDTGVFTGVMYQDYAFGGQGGSGELEGWLGIGSAGSVVSGRIAYTFGFEGPAVTVDTACSSSLVALHLAAQALRSGESSLAIAGGVTVLANPMLFVEFSRQRGLSPDGRCKSFGADADGVGWAEGAGLVVLERLSDAQRLGHPVLAVVRGSAVNQDGASNGLAAPNGPSQERVIERALANAGLSPADVDVVEGHGTGTTLGDPIEAQALLETYGQSRANGPLRLGSVKSNIGHTQAAAGVAGVIKMVQAMRHGLLPPSLHCEQPSPHVDWSAGQIELLHDAVEWPAGARPRRAGVSSFGISGTNAHVILEEAPAPARAERPTAPSARVAVVPLPISGRGEAGLRGQAARLREQLAADPELDPVDVGYSLVTSRARLHQRAVVLGSSREELIAGLDALAAGNPGTGVITGEARFGMTAFLFTGQGAQRPGMGAALYREQPVFARALDAVCAELDPRLGRSLRELMLATEGSPEAALLDRTEFTQASVFALEVALYRLLESWGVRADRLVGHSIGELTAAHVAGVLSLADACALVAARGRLMGALPEGGAMLAIEASEDEVAATLAAVDGVSLAAVNGPRAVVVSGETDAIAEIEALWAERARRTSRLAVSHAFHSHLMEPMLAEFRAVAEGLSFQPPRIPIVSNLTGAEISEQLCDPDYWVAHVREPVRFADGVRALEQLGVTRFVELGPDAVLTALARDSVSEELADRGLFVPALRRDRDELRTLLACLGALETRGASVDWSAYYEGTGARRVELPTYAFQRERYWLTAVRGAGDVAAAGLAQIDHPLLGAAVPAAAADEWLFTGTWSLATHPWIGDHAVFDTVLLPGTGFAELALCVAGEVGCEAIEELMIESPLLLPEHGAVQVQVSVGEPQAGGRREIEIWSRPEQEHADGPSDWTRNASGLLTPVVDGAGEARAERLAGEPWPPPGAERIDVEDLYDRLAASGYAYGPVFQGVTAAWRRGEEVLAEVSLDGDSARAATGFGIHPALFDAGFHALLGLLSDGLEPGHVPLPFMWSGVRLLQAGASSMRVSVRATGEDTLSLTALDERGAPTLVVETVMARTIDVARMASARDAGASSLFVMELAEIPLAASNGAAPRFATIGDVAGAPAGAQRYEDLAELGAALDAGAAVPDAVFAAVGDGHEGEDEADAVHDAVRRALALLQQWVASDAFADARLVLVTRGAVAARAGEVPQLPAAAVWGLARSAAAENPGRIVSVDLDGDGDTPWLPLLAVDDPQLAIRSGAAYAPRFARPPAQAQAAEPATPGGTVLVTGGTGGLGAVLARHLAERGARHLLLASRRGADAEGSGELVAQLAERGCEATLAACDLADRDAVARLLASIPPERPLTAVIHTAGVMEDGTIPSLAPDQVDRVLAPKVDGSLHLHELTRDLQLADFILFSSAAPLLGGAGQGSYAAANAVLDALAQRRRAQGLPATSMAWGLWNVASGMAGAAAAEFERIGQAIRARIGLVPMPPDQGLELFERARSIDATLIVPAPLDAGVLRAQARTGALPPVLRGVVRAVARRERGGGDALAQQLAGRPPEEWDAVLLEIVRGELAAVLGHESDAAIDPDRSILELGLDSLGAVELRNRLGRSTNVRIAPTVAFETPTPRGLAAYLADRLRDGAGGDAAAADANGSGGTLTVLLQQAHERGLLGDFVPLLVSASRFRPAFRSAAELDRLPPLVSFASGTGTDDGAELICVPSFLAGSGPHQFARLAAGFGGERTVSAFSLPGFRAGERVPASWSAAVEALAAAVREQAPNGAFVLAGYSIGGALAHALTRRLEDDGLAPAGLVLIDTYAPAQQDEMAALFGEVMGSVLDERHALIEAVVDDDNLMTMGTYARLMAEWEPQPIAAPSLLVRASVPLGDARERGTLPWWQLPPEVVEVTGHHFELIGEAAAQTAGAIDAWVRETICATRPQPR